MQASIKKASRLFVCVTLLSLVGCSTKHADFGEPMKLSAGKTVDVAEVFANKFAYDGRTVRLAGTVADVCKAKGCWLTMTDGESNETLFVKFTCPVKGRLVPMEAIGHRVIVEGVLTVEEVPEDEARHYAEDSGAPADEIARIVGPQERVRMKSPSARIKGIEQPESAG